MPGVVSGQRDMLGDVVGSARNVRVRGERDERACSYRIDVVVIPFGDGSVPSQEVVSNLNHRFLLRRQVRLRVPGSLSIRIEPLGYASGILVILLRARCGEEKRQENRRERGRVESSTHRRGDPRTGCSKQKYTKVMNDALRAKSKKKLFPLCYLPLLPGAWPRAMGPRCPQTLLPVPVYVSPTPTPQLILVDVWVAEVDKRRCNQVVRARTTEKRRDAHRRRRAGRTSRASPPAPSFEPDTLVSAPLAALTPCAAQGHIRGAPPDGHAARQARAPRRRR